ncbi:MAG: ferritin [Rhabdochlamydiaceae bacterium]|nr:ferritin [Rhabdochlamydiaceae bacterium]
MKKNKTIKSVKNKSEDFDSVQMTPLSGEILKLLEQQMAEEYKEALFYLQQTVYFERVGLTGFSKWCKNHYTEELSHATAIMNYLLARGVNARISNVIVIDKTFHDAGSIFEAMLALEVSSTGTINNIHRKSLALNDHETLSFVQTLIKKQIDEEYLLAKLVKRIRFVKQDPTALLNIDQELEASTINEGVISANYRVLNSSAKAVGVFGSSALSYVGASNDL